MRYWHFRLGAPDCESEMHESSIDRALPKHELYARLATELRALIADESDATANLANAAALLHHSLPDLNWSGFYLWNDEDKELVLGPFQGKPACIRISPERGVCGAAYKQKKTMRVNDVHAFPGHIACDSASLSELVVPLVKNGVVHGVLDLDSPTKNRFNEQDAAELTRIFDRLSQLLFYSK